MNRDNINYFTPQRVKMARSEWWRKWRADFGGYFWLPCPICDTYSAGYEWKTEKNYSSILTDQVGLRNGVCPACTDEERGDPDEWVGIRNLDGTVEIHYRWVKHDEGLKQRRWWAWFR